MDDAALVLTYGGVAVPDISIDMRQRLTGFGVNQLDIHEERNASLVFNDVLANKLAGNV